MVRIALVGPLSGTFEWVGESVLRGAAAALRSDKGVDLVTMDTADGSRELADYAEEIAGAGEISAVVGPTFSREVEAMGVVLSRAGVPFVLPLATKPELGEQGWPSFFRIVASDAARGNLTAKVILDTLGSNRPAVASERSQSAQRAAGRVADALRHAGVRPLVTPMLERGTRDVSGVAATIEAAESDAVYYAGEYREGALLRRELSRREYSGLFVVDEGALTPEFVATCTPEYAENVLSVGPGSPSATLSDVTGLALDFGHTAFIAEGYQCGSLLNAAIGSVGAERNAITRFLRAFDGSVAGRSIRFSPVGENAHETFYVYQVQSGEWKYCAEVSNDRATKVEEQIVAPWRGERGLV